jgi:hypothetical protein
MANHYHQIITEATGETNAQRLAQIEESMRQDVFHSTLDWQAKDHLFWGAKEAVKILAATQESSKKPFDSADANLISAAPDLFAALVALLQDEGAADDITAVRKQARAAIAKART